MLQIDKDFLNKGIDFLVFMTTKVNGFKLSQDSMLVIPVVANWPEEGEMAMVP